MNGFLAFRISNNIGKTPEGFLIARSAVVSRTATLEPLIYTENEIGYCNSGKQVRVWRTAADLFHPSSLASLEGKPITLHHPGRFLRAEDTAGHIRGHVQNVRPGSELLPNGEVPLLADLVIFDPELISEIESGRTREVSLGYDCAYEPLSNGDWQQTQMLYNHAALVTAGRAGRMVAVKDGGTMTGKELIEKIAEIMRPFRGRTLGDGLSEMADGARKVEELTASGCGPSSFHEALRQHSPAYRDFEAQRQVGDEFANNARAAGKAMGERLLSSVRTRDHRDCRAPVTTPGDSEGDWAAAMNLHGKRLRGGR